MLPTLNQIWPPPLSITHRNLVLKLARLGTSSPHRSRRGKAEAQEVLNALAEYKSEIYDIHEHNVRLVKSDIKDMRYHRISR